MMAPKSSWRASASPISLIDRQLGVALARLLDRPGAGECRRDVLADEREDLHVLFAVVLVGGIRLDDDEPDDAVVGQERDAEPVLALLADGLDLTRRRPGPASARG